MEINPFKDLQGKDRLSFSVSLVVGTSPTIKKVTTFANVLDEIKSQYEKEREQVQQLRKLKHENPTEYKKQKEYLPGFIIGEFTERKDSACISYVPCLAFDLDGIGEDLATILLSDLKKIPYVFSAFFSPGAGLRVLVWCASNQDSHKSYYKTFCEHLSDQLGDFIKTDAELVDGWKKEGFEKKEIAEKLKTTPHIDTSTSNISRLWFYVPLPEDEIYLNLDSQVFYLPKSVLVAETKDKRPRKKKELQEKSIIKNGGELTETEKIGACEMMANERNSAPGRNNHVFLLACLCWEHGVSQDSILSHCLKYSEPDFPEAEVKKTVDSAIKRSTFQKFSDQNLLNYSKVRFTHSANGNSKTFLKTTNKTQVEEINLQNGLERIAPNGSVLEAGNLKSQPTKKSKFVQVEEYLFESYEFRKNIISIDIEYREKDSNQEFKELNENDLIIELLRMGFTGIEAPLIALLKSSLVPEYDPFLAYKNALPVWDKSQPDYITQLANYVKAKDQYWFNSQFKKMLVRSAACALNIIPFNKQCFTLLGKQNDGKSSFLRFLCPDSLRKYFKEDLDFNNKDGRLALCTNFFINLDELASLSRFELNKIKNHFTLDQVKERLPYDRKPSVFPRRASFLASTNEDEFLTDSTGNVRWLVLEIDGIKHDNGGKNGYSQNIKIDLVWSQVFYLLDHGFDFKLSVEEIKKSELNNKQHKVLTPELELIQSKYMAGSKNDNDPFYTATDILKNLLLDNPKMNLTPKRIGAALKDLGIEKDQQYSAKAGYQIKGYYLKEI